MVQAPSQIGMRTRGLGLPSRVGAEVICMATGGLGVYLFCRGPNPGFGPLQFGPLQFRRFPSWARVSLPDARVTEELWAVLVGILGVVDRV